MARPPIGFFHIDAGNYNPFTPFGLTGAFTGAATVYLPRSFRCPGMPVVPAIGVVFSLWLISFLSPDTWMRFAVWFLIGLVVYFAYSRRRSALSRSSDAQA